MADSEGELPGYSEKDFAALAITESSTDSVCDAAQLHPAGSTMKKRSNIPTNGLEGVGSSSPVKGDPVSAGESPAAKSSTAQEPAKDGESSREGNTHSYSDVDPSTFSLRIGPDYDRNKKKAPAGPALYEAVGLDFVHTASRIDNIGSKVELPAEWTSRETNHPLVPPVIIFNAQMPRDFSTSFFSTVDDGDGWSLVLYLRITEATAAALADLPTAPPAVQLLARYCSEAPDAFEKFGCSSSQNEWVGRLKLLLRCEDIEQFGLPSFITSYNAKPVLIRNTGTFLRGNDNRYVEMDLNVHKFASLPKKGLEVLFNRFSRMESSIGICIESRNNEEMPEALFGCFGLHCLDPGKSQPFLYQPAATTTAAVVAGSSSGESEVSPSAPTDGIGGKDSSRRSSGKGSSLWSFGSSR